jgi:hypothetical protein
MEHIAPQGAWHLENWASQLLAEKGHTIGRPEGGPTIRLADMSRLVDDRFMTNEEIINKASEYRDWKGRKRLFLQHLNVHQDSLRKKAR